MKLLISVAPIIRPTPGTKKHNQAPPVCAGGVFLVSFLKIGDGLHKFRRLQSLYENRRLIAHG